MKVQKLRVGKGRTSRPGEAEEWIKEYYEIEVVIEDPSELEVTKANIEGLIDGWLTPSKPTTKLPANISQLDSDELARLPWKTYQTKQPSKPGEAGWIFGNTKGAKALLDTMKKQGESVRVQIGPHTFDVKLSGDQKQFIGRAPVKS